MAAHHRGWRKESGITVENISPEGMLKIISVGRGKWIDLAATIKLLRRRYSIRPLLCEGGPTVYGQLLQRRLIDEDFRTLSMQVLGHSTFHTVDRPSSYGDVSYDVYDRHVDVENDVALQFDDFSDGFLSVRGVAADLEAMPIKKRADARTRR